MCLSKIKIPGSLFITALALALSIIAAGKLHSAEIYPPEFFMQNSDSARIGTRYNWFVRKQFLPVNYHWFSFGVDEGMFNNSNISRTTQLSLSTGRYINISNFIKLSGSYGWMFLKESSSLNREVEDDIQMYNISLEFKSFLPSYIPGIVQYFIFGFGMDDFLFKYKIPVVLEYNEYPFEGTIIEKEHDDHFTAFNIYTGFGFNLAEINDYQICAEVTPGYILPATETYLGMENPLMKKSFYIKLKMSVCIPYGEL